MLTCHLIVHHSHLFPSVLLNLFRFRIICSRCNIFHCNCNKIYIRSIQVSYIQTSNSHNFLSLRTRIFHDYRITGVLRLLGTLHHYSREIIAYIDKTVTLCPPILVYHFISVHILFYFHFIISFQLCL